MRPSEKLKSDMITHGQALKFAEKDKEKILKQLEMVTVKISNYKEEIMEMQLAIQELESKGL